MYDGISVASIELENRLQFSVGPLPRVGRELILKRLERFYEGETGIAQEQYTSISYVRSHGTTSIVLSVQPDFNNPAAFMQRLCDVIRQPIKRPSENGEQ